MTVRVISDAEYRLPGWASDVRRLTPETVEYWKPINLLASSDSGDQVPVELVQRVPGAPIQLLIGETRLSLGETTDLLNDVAWCLRIMQRIALE